MFSGCPNLPFFSPTETGKTRAYEGVKDSKNGYFTQGSGDKAYLLNRGGDKDSIIKKYRQATSVVFTHTAPSTYMDSIDIDRDLQGKIKAYQVKDGEGYKVLIYSDATIYTSGTSFASFLKNFIDLESVDFGDVNTSEATSFVGMFSHCEKIKNVVLNFDTTNVSNFSYMFDGGCKSLKELNLGDNFVIKKDADLT